MRGLFLKLLIFRNIGLNILLRLMIYNKNLYILSNRANIMFSKKLVVNFPNPEFSGTLIIPERAEIELKKNPTGMLGRFGGSVRHTQVTEDIFKIPPSVNDIKQGAGNCFLLSCLNAIVTLPNGKEIIQSMIKDRGKDVVVRLFDVYGKPHYIAIEKSVPVFSGTVSSGALWVRFIEKAYTTFNGTDYSVLEKGNVQKAMLALTGARTNVHYKKDYFSFPFQATKRISDLKEFVNANDIYLLHDLMNLSDKLVKEKKIEAITTQILQEVFKNDEETFASWVIWIKDKRSAWHKLIQENHPINMTHIKDFFNSHSKNEELETQAINNVVNWLEKENILPGLPLSGQYSKEELKTFYDIKDRLENNLPLTVDTGKDDIKPGLLPLHTYAVIGVEERYKAVIGIEENPESGHKYIIVRNPFSEDRNWFHKMIMSGGRNSVEVPVKDNPEKKWEIKIETTNKSTARMELSDFCSSFTHCDAFESVSVSEIDKRVEKHFPPPKLETSFEC